MQCEKQDEYIRSIWDKCVKADKSHEYIERKQGMAEGLRVNEAKFMINNQNILGYLAVPCIDYSTGEILTIQFIPPNKGGDKLNLPRASFDDGFFMVGNPSDTFYICEGIGQAWAMYQSTCKTAICSFGLGRMKTVAKTVRELYSNEDIVLVPDGGKHNEKMETIAKEINCDYLHISELFDKNYDVNDFALDYGYDELKKLIKDNRRVPKIEHSFKTISFDDLINRKVSPNWLVEDIIEDNCLCQIFGEKSSGKSFIGLDLAYCVASGINFFGRKTKKSGVLYITGEGFSGLSRRNFALAQKYNIPREHRALLEFSEQPAQLMTLKSCIDVQERIRAENGNFKLVIIDTLNRNFGPGDENQTKDMTVFLSNIDAFIRSEGCAVIIIHHTGLNDKTRGRGNSSLPAALDTMFMVEMTDRENKIIVMTCKKSKESDENDFDFNVKLKTVEIGIDEFTNKPFYSCVLEDTHLDGDKQRENTIYGSLHNAINDTGHYCEIDGKQVKCAYEKDWFRFAKMLLDTKNKARDFQTAKERLIESGSIAMFDNSYYPV
jgi:archaellum biogenesis ATPase FlaH